MVEAMGQLSNPIVSGVSPDPKGLSGATEVKKKVKTTRKRTIFKSLRPALEDPGWLSNPYSTFNMAVAELLEIMKDAEGRKQGRKTPIPALRHLSKADVDLIVAKYQAGSSIKELVKDMRLHRTTIMHQLEKRGIPRRRNRRKMNDVLATEAKHLHNLGYSYYALAGRYQV